MGRLDEEWDTTEEKVRDFIRNDLNMPKMERVEIERAHRIKSYDQNKCTIIVKLNRYKDREAILKKASEVLGEDSSYSVRQDLTQRVKKHRRELGKEMIAAKARGHEGSRTTRTQDNSDPWYFSDPRRIGPKPETTRTQF